MYYDLEKFFHSSCSSRDQQEDHGYMDPAYCIPTFSEKNLNDKIKENERKNNMSLVLMLKSKHGLVAASDSKSTLTLGYGEEAERSVQKVFSGENYLLATWGENRVHVGNWCRMEDIMKEMVETYPYDYKKLLHNFHKKIEGGPYQVYHFLIGFYYDSKEYPGNPVYIVEEYSVSPTGILLHQINDNIADCIYPN